MSHWEFWHLCSGKLVCTFFCCSSYVDIWFGHNNTCFNECLSMLLSFLPSRLLWETFVLYLIKGLIEFINPSLSFFFGKILLLLQSYYSLWIYFHYLHPPDWNFVGHTCVGIYPFFSDFLAFFFIVGSQMSQNDPLSFAALYNNALFSISNLIIFGLLSSLQVSLAKGLSILFF